METRVLKNGAIQDVDTGRIVSGKNATTKITSQNSAALHRKRREKAAALIRQQIIEANNTHKGSDGQFDMTHVISAAGGVANAAGALWSEIVLDPTSYPRDRREVWETIAKHAGVIGDARRDDEQPVHVDNAQILIVASDVARELLARRQQQAQQDTKE